MTDNSSVVVMVTNQDLDSVQVGDKYNLGSGKIIEITGFEKGSTQSRWINGGWVEEQINMVTYKTNDEKVGRYVKTVLLLATKNLDETIVACAYCGVLSYPDNIKYATIISRNWASNGYKSPQRPYCKDKPCRDYDQMGHEG